MRGRPYTVYVDNKKSNQNTTKQVVHWVYKLGGKRRVETTQNVTPPCFHGNLALSGIITLSVSFLNWICFYWCFQVSWVKQRFLYLFIPLVSFLFSFNFVIIGKGDILASWNSCKIWWIHYKGCFGIYDILTSYGFIADYSPYIVNLCCEFFPPSPCQKITNALND